jgi:hypothetical protein
LPWLDAELAVFVAVNRHLGDDVAIALDYRVSRREPRVVASEYVEDEKGARFEWRRVADTFGQFAEDVGL